MQEVRLEKQEASPIDDATKAALEQAYNEYREGEGVTLEQAVTNARNSYKAWKKTQEKLAA